MRSYETVLVSETTGVEICIYLEDDNDVDPFVVGLYSDSGDMYVDLSLEQTKKLRDHLIKMLEGK